MLQVESLSDFLAPLHDLAINAEMVETVNAFTYLGASISSTCCSDPEITRRLGMAKASMKDLELIWRSHLALKMKVRFYNICIIPIALYALETFMGAHPGREQNRWFWSVVCGGLTTSPTMRYVSTLQPPLSSIVTERHLTLFGHVAMRPHHSIHWGPYVPGTKKLEVTERKTTVHVENDLAPSPPPPLESTSQWGRQTIGQFEDTLLMCYKWILLTYFWLVRVATLHCKSMTQRWGVHNLKKKFFSFFCIFFAFWC